MACPPAGFSIFFNVLASYLQGTYDSGRLMKLAFPQGLGPVDFAGFTYGLKPVPFKTAD
jgi:hypothetical protein